MKTISLFKFLSKKNTVIILLIWLISQSLLLFKFGITDTHEAARFIQNGRILLAEQKLGEYQLFYSFYLLIIAISLFFTKSIIPIVFLQLSLNLVSTILFYKICNKLVSKNNSLWATLLMIIFYPLQQWNFYIYTESIFISEIIILLYLLLFLNFDKSLSYIWLGIIYTVTFFTRPPAVYLAIPILLFLGMNYKLFDKTKLAATMFIILIFGLIGKSFQYHYYINSFMKKVVHENWIIGGYSGINIISLPDNFCAYHCEIISKRFIYYFGLIRPYYSKIHNIYLASFNPIYLFAAIGIFNRSNFPRKINFFIILVIAAFSTGTLLTFINWHGRFIAPIIPLIIIMAAIGYQKVSDKYFHKSDNLPDHN